MKKIVKLSLAVAMMSGLGAVSAQADGDILSDVKVKGQIRPRLETVDDSVNKSATAFTARTKLTINANLFGVEGLTSSIGMISVNNFGMTDHNSGANGHSDAAGNTAYAKIIDPQDAMLSEATIDYAVGKTALHLGRSNINLDNQRFIGTVGWRQLERSYDTVYAANSSVENLSVLAAYVYGFAGVTGVTTTDTNSAILHVGYKAMPALNVTGYAYLLGSISDTYGLALTGKIDAGAKLTYRAEYAMQSDATLETYNAASGAVDASYFNVDFGANISGVLLGVNYEMLSGSTGSDGKTNFQPTLGTNHKFNGWADKFFVGNTGPLGGLNDMNVRAGYKAKGFGKLLAVYHVFSASENMATATATDTDLGSEIDVVYANTIPGAKGLKGLIKYAGYTGGTVTGYTANVSKVWLGLDYKFSN